MLGTARSVVLRTITHGTICLERRAHGLRAWQTATIMAAAFLVASIAGAGDGTSFSVSTSATVTGSAVSGVLTVSQAESEPITFSAMTVSLEVRFDDGVPIPALPAGSDDGWYRVAQVALAAPVVLPAGGSQAFPFVIDPCTATVPNYRGAKDMRAFGSVTGGRVRDAYSYGFPLPSPCPVCGNAVVEAGEQCDAGANGGSCCTAACQFRPSGTTCNDGNACTQVDACEAGACVGGDSVVCTTTDPCRVAGVCAPTTGVCSQPARPNGSACNDGNACTRTDTCQSGTCRGASPVVCSASNPCLDATCDPTTGACANAPKPDGTACADSSACTTGDQCVGGACTPGVPLACNDFMSCTADSCNDATGCSFSPATTCEACDVTQCTDCSTSCETAQVDCETGCWAGFSGCLAGCTSTYCAPFCQVDLGQCLASCPTVTACQSACESGNGCGAGCSGGVTSLGAPPPVPSFSRLGIVALAAFLALVGSSTRIGPRRRGAPRDR